MIEAFKGYISKNQLFEAGQKILLAVSGGIDSMVMASIFLQLGINTGLAHCNFKLRKTESDEDEIFVKEIAHKYNIPLYVKRFETSDFACEKKLSIQVAARDLRYEWFGQLIEEENYDFYATAHHFDDQIETFFINLLRSSGISGLRGILPKTGNCIRPLLFATRKMIEQYAFENNVNYREDSSNSKDDYLRNRIRHYIIPALEKSEKNFRTGFQSTLSILSETEKFIQTEMNKKITDFVTHRDDSVLVNMKKLSQEKNLSFVLFELLKPYNFNYSTTLNIVESLDKQSGKVFLSASHELVIDREFIIISKLLRRNDEVFEIQEDSKEIFTPIHLVFETIIFNKNTPILPEKNIAFFDLNKLNFPLKLRRYREGDKFYPLGMNDQKKLSDFFIDKKIPLPEKRIIWLLISGEDIAWIINQRIDDRFKISCETTKALVVKLI